MLTTLKKCPLEILIFSVLSSSVPSNSWFLKPFHVEFQLFVQTSLSQRNVFSFIFPSQLDFGRIKSNQAIPFLMMSRSVKVNSVRFKRRSVEFSTATTKIESLQEHQFMSNMMHMMHIAGRDRYRWDPPNLKQTILQHSLAMSCGT
jgi:hypothetical protein